MVTPKHTWTETAFAGVRIVHPNYRIGPRSDTIEERNVPEPFLFGSTNGMSYLML